MHIKFTIPEAHTVLAVMHDGTGKVIVLYRRDEAQARRYVTGCSAAIGGDVTNPSHFDQFRDAKLSFAVRAGLLPRARA